MRINRRRLDNGIPVILIPTPGAKQTTHVVAVGGGDRYETARLLGASHFLEHMMFMTHRRKRAGDFDTEIDNMRGEANAYTYEESILFFITAPAEFFEPCVDLISDITMNAHFHSKVIANEKNIIKREWGAYLSDPDTLSELLLKPLMYESLPLARTVDMELEVLDQITANQLRELLKRYINTENMAIVIAGRVPSEKRVMRILNKYYAGIPAGTKPRKYRAAFRKNQEDIGVSIYNLNIPQSSITISARCPSRSDDDYYAACMLDTILGSPASGRLMTAVRYSRGLAYSAYSSLDSQMDIGHIFIQTSVNPHKVEKALKVIRDELVTLRDKSIVEDELEKAQNIVKREFDEMYADSQALALEAASHQILDGEVDRFEKVLNELLEVTAEDIQRVAQKIFINARINLAVVGRHNSEDEDKFRKILSI